MQPEQNGMTEVVTDVVPEETEHRPLGKRADSKPFGRCRRLTEAEPLDVVSRPQGEQERDRFVAETASRERQHAGGRRIQPLDVVDRDRHRTG